MTPILPAGLSEADKIEQLRELLAEYVAPLHSAKTLLWYYSPLMLEFSRGQIAAAAAVVYDCMDELANFRFAHERTHMLEDELLASADLVFAGGRSLYEAKLPRHQRVHLFPSSVDARHFEPACAMTSAPTEAPTLGFFGVIDERLDLDLLARLADARPGWRFEIVGPTAKIDPDDLPRRANIRYPGAALYADLPRVIAGWDVALMPFALNEATRFISPTKTPEYLAAGRPVVSTAIADVVASYGDLEAVAVCEDFDSFVGACEHALEMFRGEDKGWLTASDARLQLQSWDGTQHEMQQLIEDAVARRALHRRPAATAVSGT